MTPQKGQTHVRSTISSAKRCPGRQSLAERFHSAGAACLLLGLLTALTALTASAAWGQSDKRLEIHEWAVWGTSPNLESTNDESRFPTAMPVIVESARTGSAERIKAAAGLAPVSIVTFHGDPQADIEIGVRSQAGRIVAHWPRGTQSNRRLRWNHVDLLDKQPDDARYAIVIEDHWFNRARQLNTLYLKVGTRDERFIAYDPVVKWSVPLALSGGPDTFTLVNTSTTPLLDVAICVPTPEGRRIAWLDTLPGAAPPSQEEKPADAPLTASQTIEAHAGGVACLAVAADGQMIATAGDDHQIKIWQLSEGDSHLTLSGHTAPITGLVFLPDGEKLVSVSRDKTLRTWSVSQGTQLASEQLSDEGLTLGISGDGKRLIAGAKDGKGMILDPIEGKVVAKTYNVHREDFQAVAVSPDRRRVVTGGGDRTAKIWNILNNTYTAGAGTLKGHAGGVTAVAILPDNKTAVTGSADGTVRLWDLAARSETKSLKQSGPVVGLALSSNGETLAIAVADEPALVLYDLKKEEQAARLEGHTAGIRAVAAAGDNAWITASADGTVKRWGELKIEPTKLKGPPVEVTLSSTLAAGSSELAAETTEALKRRVQAVGLAEDEADLLLSMYARPMFESDKLVVIARVPQDELETKLPYDVYPEPTRVVRVALVVVTDIDPRVAGEITELIAQLGDAQYDRREAAEKRLAELGPLALPALREALKQNDVELVFRAERLLLAQNQQIDEQK